MCHLAKRGLGYCSNLEELRLKHFTCATSGGDVAQVVTLEKDLIAQKSVKSTLLAPKRTSVSSFWGWKRGKACLSAARSHVVKSSTLWTGSSLLFWHFELSLLEHRCQYCTCPQSYLHKSQLIYSRLKQRRVTFEINIFCSEHLHSFFLIIECRGCFSLRAHCSDGSPNSGFRTMLCQLKDLCCPYHCVETIPVQMSVLALYQKDTLSRLTSPENAYDMTIHSVCRCKREADCPLFSQLVHSGRKCVFAYPYLQRLCFKHRSTVDGRRKRSGGDAF